MTPYKGAYSQRNRYRNYAVANGVKYYSIRAVANNTTMGRVIVEPSPVTAQVDSSSADANQQYANYTASSSSSVKTNSITSSKKTSTVSGYKEDMTVTITAYPKPGYRFVKWTGMPTGARIGSTNESKLSFNARCDLSLTAVFEADPNYHQGNDTVTVKAQCDAEKGSVAPAEPKTIGKGDAITLTATEKAGFRFVSWKGIEGLADSTQKTVSIRPQADVNAVAVFAKDDSRDPEDPGDPFSPETPSAGDPTASQPRSLVSVIRKYWWIIAIAVAWYLHKEGKL